MAKFFELPDGEILNGATAPWSRWREAVVSPGLRHGAFLGEAPWRALEWWSRAGRRALDGLSMQGGFGFPRVDAAWQTDSVVPLAHSALRDFLEFGVSWG
jgi:hypothetical protein